MSPLFGAYTDAVPDRRWDVVVVGGGITGAGVFREAARAGLDTLLIERGDFASGTSGRSANLIHGGLRYLTHGRFGLVRRATRARDDMLRSAPDLVHPLRFVLSVDASDRRATVKIRAALCAYDLLSGSRPKRHAWRPRRDDMWAGLGNGPAMARFEYEDAVTDDVGLVLRVLREGRDLGGHALSYSPVHEITPTRRGSGARVRLGPPRLGREIEARTVVRATGAAIGSLGTRGASSGRIRRIRGSHLVLHPGIFPADHAVAGYHPTSYKPIYIVPWKGVAIVGTTHVEERSDSGQPRPSAREIRYLIEGARSLLPGVSIGLEDIRAVYAGIRPIADDHTPAAADASRDHLILQQGPIVSVHGGKLTTFHDVALRTMSLVARRLGIALPRRRQAVFGVPNGAPDELNLPPETVDRLGARYGTGLLRALKEGPCADRKALDAGQLLRGELRWILRHEGITHLDDLMLRRLRFGITRRTGGISLLPAFESLVREELAWSASRWASEVARYVGVWKRDHAPPRADQDQLPRRRRTPALIEAG